MKNYNVKCIEEGKLNINGKGDDELWSKAEILSDFISAWDSRPNSKIEFRSLWDSKKLFFYFKVFDSQIIIDEKDNNEENIGNSDRVELFFKMNDTLNPYYCIEIDPKSRILDFRANAKRKFEFDWCWPKGELEVKSNITAHYFTVEGAITINSLKGLDLIKNYKIETGIFRAKYYLTENSKHESTWISWVNPNTQYPNFHTSSSFGVLHLLKE
ncbi:sugar-binding protein [Cellulophaga lytica]|uniref:sugar-binding protein n=1 Tax=Cellulophaga lytica TaxID=979 RepID=UPI00095036D2|nr:sugar-binding protein [Cellulophaga lytica]APU11164.1 hypothetical protein A5M85_13015 [Cellulophaga lytica]MDO6854729.1 sugar-binding protein [Cellulophaga lytica]SNQ45047.1 Endoxylanase [Cellulophaga lytica]